MTVLPEPPAATAAGQAHRDAAIEQQADQLLAAINAITPAQHPDARPKASIGDASPVAQPGIPPQGRAAVDYAVRVLSTGVATAVGSGGIALVLAASKVADPMVCGIVFGAPIGLAVPIAALSSLAKRTREVVEAAPAEVHQHFNGTVHQDQRNVDSKNVGFWVKNTNEQ